MAVHWVVNMNSVSTAGAPLAALVAFVALLGVACADDVIPPCTPAEGSDIDPCALGNYFPDRTDALGHAGFPTDMRDYLESRSSGNPNLVAHIVIRGTTLPGTVRCRAGAFRPMPENFFEGDSKLACYVDVRVNEYIVGTGPSVLRVEHTRYFDEDGRGQELLDDMEHAVTFGGVAATFLQRGGGVAGREWVLFLVPPWDKSVEVWEIGDRFDVQRLDDDIVATVKPPGYYFFTRPEFIHYSRELRTHFMFLDVLVRGVKEAHEERLLEYGGHISLVSDAPMLVQDARELGDYLRAIGAYDHPDGPPVLPP